MLRGRPVGAVLFDLDDTLVPQAPWLAGAFAAVASEVEAATGVPATRALDALLAHAARGSARGGIIDAAVASLGLTVPVAPLVDTFRAYRAARLDPFPGARAVVARLRSTVPVGLVTDGDPGIQRAKLAASGLDGAFDVVVCSDELGRAYRKPHPLPYRSALRVLGVGAEDTVFVGDRPDTDLVGAAALGMATVRVTTGEYARSPDVVPPTATVPHVRMVAELLALPAP